MSYDDDTDTIQCNECGADVYSDAEQCPKCGTYLVDSDFAESGARESPTPRWVKWTAFLMVAIFLLFAILPLLQTFFPAPAP